MKTKFLGKVKNKSKKTGKNLLDNIPRVHQDIKFGSDIWNVYDFMYLDKNKTPHLSVLEIIIPSNSDFIIESKSMKLYLNSFFNKDYANQAEVINIITKRISNKCNSDVKIISKSSFKTFDKSNFTNKSGLLVYKGFRSICPVTSQPDWGNIYIYSSTDTLKKKEIYDFLFSLRNHGGFHESCVEKVFLYIKETSSVDHLEICGRFLRRGGIDINPIRSSQKKLFFKNFREFNQ